ncbi:PEP-CTERM sorting domain-containing protein [Duganella sp. HH105]|uniref:PEP-CTERM sorting domain-containing protein n=1 Tax=Duganella sp. HH105 TaxID=1781067 RepID=UPI000877D0A4|nr:PEP-CTERM sorting domain-containing protein [Duganella sp. HH105]OEZ58532.1 PEP-CTERM motif protein [Duganella sp. HH105]
MMKKLVCGALLAACSTFTQVACAAPTEWEFTWTGFRFSYNGYYSVDHPEYQVKGTFAGTDANHDGTLSMNELSSLKIDFVDYAACPPNTSTYTCRIDNFSYSEAGGLVFGARETVYSDPPNAGIPWWTADSISYDELGITKTRFGYQMPPEDMGYYFDSYTTKTVKQISAVPEPETYAMLVAGMMLLGGLARRRKYPQ